MNGARVNELYELKNIGVGPNPIWEKHNFTQRKGDKVPLARASHSIAIHLDKLYVFGG